MRKTLYLLALAAMGTPLTNVHAQDSTAAVAADAGKLTISGYLDSYYLTAFNKPKSGNLMGYFPNYNAVGYARAFDRLTDQFSLGLVQTKLAYTTAKSEMVIDLTFGPNAELGNFGNQRMAPAGQGYTTGFFPGNANQSALYGTGAAIKQAYFTYKFTDKWNFTIGQFGTHIGYEVIDAPVNYHYSLSNLFNNGPFYHIGAKTQYMFSDKFGVMAGVVNNWDAMTDWKSQKSIIGQVFVSPLEGWNLYVNYIGGYNDDGFKVYSGPGTRVGNTAYGYHSFGYNRQMIDLTTGYQITDKFYVGLNAALGWYTYQLPNDNYEFNKNGGVSVVDATVDADGDGEDDVDADGNTIYAPVFSDPDANGKSNVTFANKGFGSQLFSDSSKYQTWGGVAIYTNYKINDMLGIGVRYEHFDDRNGVRYLNGVNNSITITMPITLADGHVLIKPEFRWDTGVLGYAYSGTANPNGVGGGAKTTTGEGLYETNDEWAEKNVNPTGANYIPTFTPSQTTIGLAFIYKY